MSVFDHYAHYYDLLYRDKDYAGEAGYVAGLIRRHAPGARRVLELGCGTGRHAALLAGDGFEVTGLDASSAMLARARDRAAADAAAGARLTFREGDVRSFELGGTFDAVISLFHVVSYQVDHADLRGMFRCVRDHLSAGGVFVFDCWYGPAVLTDRPVVRVKRFEDAAMRVVRIAEPVLHPERNVVDVNYEIHTWERLTGRHESFRETHPMRYLFRPELELLLGEAGLRIEAAEEWMTGRPPGFDTWGVCFVARV